MENTPFKTQEISDFIVENNNSIETANNTVTKLLELIRNASNELDRLNDELKLLQSTL